MCNDFKNLDITEKKSQAYLRSANIKYQPNASTACSSVFILMFNVKPCDKAPSQKLSQKSSFVRISKFSPFL